MQKHITAENSSIRSSFFTHIFIKGCSKDDYDDFFRESEDEMCDLDRHSKRDPHVFRNPAAVCLREADGGAGAGRVCGKGKDHKGL